MKTRKLKINKPLKNYKAGDIIEILVDTQGVPLDRYWRMRFSDAAIDNCVSFHIEKPMEKSEKK